MRAIFKQASLFRKLWRRWAPAACVVPIILLGGVVGCVDERALPTFFEGQDLLAGTQCAAQMPRSCSVVLERKDGVLSCYKGIQRCEEGHWSRCSDGEITTRMDPLSPRALFMVANTSLSTPTACVGNVCDPYCQFFDEDPLDITGSVTLPSSSLPVFPGSAGGASCAHAFCTEGAALLDGCHDCVTSICLAEPTCCDSAGGAWGPNCVDAVYTLCASVPVPKRVCDFAAFSSSTMRADGGGVYIVGGALGAGQSHDSPSDINKLGRSAV